MSLLGDNAFRKFRSDTLRVEPGGAFGTPDVCLCSIRHWCIKAAEPQENILLVHPFSHNVRTTSRAKAAKFARRGVVRTQQIFAPDPAKRMTRNWHNARKCRRVSLSACAAVTMHKRTGLRINFVSNGLA